MYFGAAATLQIALIWREVIKSGKGGLQLRLGNDVTMRAADLGPALRLKKAGCACACVCLRALTRTLMLTRRRAGHFLATV